MNLATTITTERGKPLLKTANNYINIQLTVHKQVIGSIELYLNADSARYGDTHDEWILNWYKGDQMNGEDDYEDPQMIDQGNIQPK